MGGENLLEKAEEQQRLLESSARELEERRQHEQRLREAIQQKEVGQGGHRAEGAGPRRSYNRRWIRETIQQKLGHWPYRRR